MLNLNESRDSDALEAMVAAAGVNLVDLHADHWLDRTVFTLAGPGLEQSVRDLARAAVDGLSLRDRPGTRSGVIDTVAFVPIRTGPPALVLRGVTDPGTADLSEAVQARDAFAAYASNALCVPCFLYGPGRPLAEARRRTAVGHEPDLGPPEPHSSAGVVIIGARDVLINYNLWLALDDVALAEEIALEMRAPEVRALGRAVGGRAQVSCNLVEPWLFGPADAFDFVAARAPVARAELVGVLPATVLDAIPAERWAELDLGEDRTIEARLSERGLLT